jgi:hypothetical protein
MLARCDHKLANGRERGKTWFAGMEARRMPACFLTPKAPTTKTNEWHYGHA